MSPALKLRVVICGSRHLRNYRAVQDAIQSAGLSGQIVEVVSGGCRGADLLGEEWAKAHGVPVRRITAEWHTKGKGAGPIRNKVMADSADAVVAVKIGGVESRGTDDMVRKAQARKLPVYTYTVSKEVAFEDYNPHRTWRMRNHAGQMEYRPRYVRKESV